MGNVLGVKGSLADIGNEVHSQVEQPTPEPSQKTVKHDVEQKDFTPTLACSPGDFLRARVPQEAQEVVRVLGYIFLQVITTPHFDNYSLYISVVSKRTLTTLN